MVTSKRSPVPTHGEFNPLEKSATVSPSHQAIAKRAYELYLRRGAQPGHAEDDWFEAERQLRLRRN